MKPRDWLESLSGGSPEHREVEWLDVLVYAEENHTGRGEAVKWLAGEMGVTERTAQRYFAVAKPGVAESQAPRRADQVDAAGRLQARIQREWDAADAADQRKQVADLLRLISRVAPGTVEVSSKSSTSKRDTNRGIRGELAVDLEKVAAAWEAGKPGRAADELSDAIMQAYGERGGVDSLQDALLIQDFADGIDWS